MRDRLAAGKGQIGMTTGHEPQCAQVPRRGSQWDRRIEDDHQVQLAIAETQREVWRQFRATEKPPLEGAPVEFLIEMAESFSQAGARWQWADLWWEQVVVHWAEKHAMHLRTGNVNWYLEHPGVVDHELVAFDNDRWQRVVDPQRLDRGHCLKQ